MIAAFDHVDENLAEQQSTQPTVVATDRHIELLLRKRAATLHVQAANYCWFTDPTKALRLKLAGTPEATTSLAGLCDAARCPQATFHPSTALYGTAAPEPPPCSSATPASPLARRRDSPPSTTEPNR